MRKLSLYIAIILYAVFIIEAITGYWIEKPRTVGSIFSNILDRKDAYVIHAYIFPVLLYGLILFHTTITLKRFFNIYVVLGLNTLILLFLLTLHIL
ncbi:hypothetical protein [Sulfurihydrogenibium subterraneum]|uniref:hypothetical protein n=1 Tax=Sulfurihydrogenibium subterraneum TaxID=171121 RepID=UPI00048A7FB3|nr:hypothetical protein [Sulfurihydrogenibium subterraneum]